MKKNVTADDVKNLISHLNSFFIHYFSTHACHVVFVGKNWDSYKRNALFLLFNIEKITLFEITTETDPKSIESTYLRKKAHPQFGGDEQLLRLNSLLQDEPVVTKSVDFLNDRNYRTDFSYSSVDILVRLSELARNYQRKDSFENNKLVLSCLLELIKETNSTINFIVMPFSRFYVENFDKNLKKETLDYINNIAADHHVFVTDLSTHEAFTPEDFYDTDHLNFNGAKKLCNLVTQLGIDI